MFELKKVIFSVAIPVRTSSEIVILSWVLSKTKAPSGIFGPKTLLPTVTPEMYVKSVSGKYKLFLWLPISSNVVRTSTLFVERANWTVVVLSSSKAVIPTPMTPPPTWTTAIFLVVELTITSTSRSTT